MRALKVVAITDTYIDYDVGNGVERFLWADLPGNGWSVSRQRRAEQVLQGFADERTPIASLPDGDPAKTADPALPHLFWDGTDLVSRPVRVLVTHSTTETIVERADGNVPRITVERLT